MLIISHRGNFDGPSEEFENKPVYNSDDLLLYFKFNEPSGSQTPLVLDHSGKSIHGVLSNHAYSTLKVRNVTTSSLAMNSSSMIYEKLDECPILFPDHPLVLSQKTTLLTDAELISNLCWSLYPEKQRQAHLSAADPRRGWSSGDLTRLRAQLGFLVQ